MSRSSKAENPSAAVPVDLVTTSAAGSTRTSRRRRRCSRCRASPRRATCRKIACASSSTSTVEGRALGLLGEPRVNVLGAQPGARSAPPRDERDRLESLQRGQRELDGRSSRDCPDQRPSPEALLEAARREEGRRGRLKIFLGAAPGVGKTYEMLQPARAKQQGRHRRRRRRRRDARPQGDRGAARRPRGHAAPSRSTTRASVLEEMDLDALLARRPQLVLVDELAHTNAPGSRHPKRYLDVEELLTRASTSTRRVNIQHIESLNDVVAQITHVRVRETVPDSILDRADAIELVDLTPDDLIQRLKEGKVYVPKQAERALEHYFSPGNLTALRELALRRTARARRRAAARRICRRTPSPGPGRRASASSSASARTRAAAGLVRYAKRLADRLHAPWTALYVETRRSLQLSDERARPHRRHAAPRRAARRRGRHDPGRRPRASPTTSSRFAQANNVTHIVIGKVHALALVRDPARLGRARSRAAAPATSAFTSSPASGSRASRFPRRPSTRGRSRRLRSVVPYAAALLAVAAAPRHRPCSSSPGSASRTSISSS